MLITWYVIDWDADHSYSYKVYFHTFSILHSYKMEPFKTCEVYLKSLYMYLRANNFRPKSRFSVPTSMYVSKFYRSDNVRLSLAVSFLASCMLTAIRLWFLAKWQNGHGNDIVSSFIKNSAVLKLKLFKRFNAGITQIKEQY